MKSRGNIIELSDDEEEVIFNYVIYVLSEHISEVKTRKLAKSEGWNEDY